MRLFLGEKMKEEWLAKFIKKKKEKAEDADKIIELNTQESLENQIKEANEKRKKIQDQLDEVCQNFGMTQNEITDFLNNPSNFSPEMWESVQRKRQALEEKVWKTVGKEKKEKLQPKEKPKNRKTKSVASRKKWIPLK